MRALLWDWLGGAPVDPPLKRAITRALNEVRNGGNRVLRGQLPVLSDEGTPQRPEKVCQRRAEEEEA